MFIEVLTPLLCILIFAVIFMISKLREFYKKEKLRELVSWSVIGDYCPILGRYSYISELTFKIANAEYEYEIKKEYCITEEIEKQYMREIIEEFQKETARSYFKGELRAIKSKYVIYGQDYFMILLHSFLDKHQCDDKFLGYEMHEETVYHKSYNGGYESTYTLTDFAVVYHKMLYISHVFCRNYKPIIESNIALPCDNTKNIEKILNTKQIEISCYRH